MHPTYKILHKDQVLLIKEWLKLDYVAQYWNGTGLQNTLRKLELYAKGEAVPFSLWVAYDSDTPFAFLMTSPISPSDLPYGKHITDQDRAITLDLLIGDPRYRGKGLCAPMIQDFLKAQKGITKVFIDPSVTNSRAIHVYEKAGFTKLEEFIPSWDPEDRCLLMIQTICQSRNANIEML